VSILALTILAACGLQEPQPHAGVAFHFPLPPGLTVRESGNGGFHFTELRRAVQPDDEADPSLKLVVVPPQVAAYDAVTLTEALVVDVAGRQAAKGWTREDGGPLARTVAGAAAVGKRVRWRQGETVLAEFDAYAYVSTEGNAVGVVLKCQGGELAAQRAELEAVLDAAVAQPFDLETTMTVSGTGFTMSVPAVSLVQQQSIGQETLHQIRTPEGMLTVYVVVPGLLESGQACSERLIVHQRSQVEALASQAGATVTSELRWLRPWSGKLLQGRTWRVRAQDGAEYEFRSLHFVADSHVITLTVQLEPARRAEMLTRYERTLDAFLPAVAPPPHAATEHFAPGLRWQAPAEWSVATLASPHGRAWILRPPSTEPLGTARVLLLLACAPGVAPSAETVEEEWRRDHLGRGNEGFVMRASEAAGRTWYSAAIAPDWLVGADRALLDHVVAGIAAQPAGPVQRSDAGVTVAWESEHWSADAARDFFGLTWTFQRGGLTVELRPCLGLDVDADDAQLATRARELLDAHRTIAGEENTRHVIHSTRLHGEVPMLMRSAIFAAPAGEIVRACYVFPRLDGHHAVEAHWLLADDTAARAALAELLDALVIEPGPARAPAEALAAGLRFTIPPGFALDQEHGDGATRLDFKPYGSAGCSLEIELTDPDFPMPVDVAQALPSEVAETRADYFAGYGAVSEAPADVTVSGTVLPGVRLHGSAGPPDMEKLNVVWSGVVAGRYVTAWLSGLDDALCDAEPALHRILLSLQVAEWTHRSGAQPPPGDHPVLGAVAAREFGPLRFLLPASGTQREDGIFTLQWTSADGRSWVRARWWDKTEGTLDLHETLRDFRDGVLPSMFRERPASVWRLLAGHPTEGQSWVSSADDEDLVYQIYSVRTRTTDVMVDAMYPEEDGAEGAAALELMLDSLRLDGQAEGEGCLVQVGDASLRAPGAPRVNVVGPAGEGLSSSALLRFAPAHELVIWIGPDTEVVRAEILDTWVVGLGDEFDEAPRSARTAGGRTAEALEIPDYGLRLLLFQEAGRRVVMASFWDPEAPEPEARACEDFVLASLRFD
jgi:hypothetical protein